MPWRVGSDLEMVTGPGLVPLAGNVKKWELDAGAKGVDSVLEHLFFLL